LVAGIVGLNPAQGMDVSVVLSCAGRGLFNGLITRTEEDKAEIWAAVLYTLLMVVSLQRSNIKQVLQPED
jgi:hypothetical protein